MQGTDAPISDRLDPARAAMLWAILGADHAAPDHGQRVPALFHYAYFWRWPGANSGEVVSGGKLRLHAPLKFGIAAEMTVGPAGRCSVLQRGALALTEDVSLSKAGAQDTPPTRSQTADIRRACSFAAETLFAYAALTMSSNRVHFESAAAGAVGLPAPVVDARLLALNLAVMAEAAHGPITAFDFRTFAPVFQDESVTLCAKAHDFWVEDATGNVVMTARAG